MKRRSPRVVSIGSQPRRIEVGDLNSQTVIATSIKAMQVKNTATGVVQTIQSISPPPVFARFGSLRQPPRKGQHRPLGGAGSAVFHERSALFEWVVSSDSSHGEAFGDVV